MGEIVFIGLGLWDEKDLSIKGLEEARSCDSLFAEFYTSKLIGTDVEKLKERIGREIVILPREVVEQGDLLIEEARKGKVGFLTAGDPMTATTHIDLRLRASKEGIETKIVHGSSVITAAAGLLGLQIYKFGRVVSIPFPQEKYFPSSPYDFAAQNKERGLHTLLLLDIDEEGRCMSPEEGIRYLLDLEGKRRKGVFTRETIICVLGGVGSPHPLLLANRVEVILLRRPERPPHCLVLPGELHFMEKEALVRLAGLPRELL